MEFFLRYKRFGVRLIWVQSVCVLHVINAFPHLNEYLVRLHISSMHMPIIKNSISFYIFANKRNVKALIDFCFPPLQLPLPTSKSN